MDKMFIFLLFFATAFQFYPSTIMTSVFQLHINLIFLHYIFIVNLSCSLFFHSLSEDWTILSVILKFQWVSIILTMSFYIFL